LDDLLSKLLAEDADSAKRFRDQCIAGVDTTPEQTKLLVLQDVWSRLFPFRQISFEDYKPTVTATLGGRETTYAAQQLSDGERVFCISRLACWMLARVS
jgi:hypothetical protein